jgi:hypothetical protein
MIMARFKGVKVNENKYFKLSLEHFEKRTKKAIQKAFGMQDICNLARLTLTPFNEASYRNFPSNTALMLQQNRSSLLK